MQISINGQISITGQISSGNNPSSRKSLINAQRCVRRCPSIKEMNVFDLD